MAVQTATWKSNQNHQRIEPVVYEPAAERIVQILRRYPLISPAESSEVVRFLRTGRYREVHQLAADKSIQKQLDDFVIGRRHELNDFANPLTAIGLIVLFLAGLWVIWQPLG